MTLPEHAACSLLIAHLGCRQKYGWAATVAVVLTGISPDLDVVTKAISEPLFWKMHHALGHCLLAIVILAGVLAGITSLLCRIPFRPLFGWCLAAALAHDLTDIPYFWGVKFFWPFHDWELHLNAIGYLDLLVLMLWGGGLLLPHWYPGSARRIAASTLTIFVLYVGLRWSLPAPTGWFHLLTGGWIYAAPNQTPVLDWW
jgi:membrane-bound metal-dependent hydrolase YbcI (DUF457 family)